MRSSRLLVGLSIWFAVAAVEWHGFAQPPQGQAPPQIKPGAAPPQSTASSPAAIAESIRRSAASFVAAYNARDARALAESYTADGEFVMEDGTAISGRAALERGFKAIFDSSPEAQISMTVESVQPLAANSVVEEGFVETRTSTASPPTASRYMAVHVLEGSRWLVAWSRDFPADDTQAKGIAELHRLQWMVGDWISETEAAVTRINCRWAGNRRYLEQTFSIRSTGRAAVSGTTRIGWDPLTRQITTWTFDSAGGYSKARWTPVEQTWVVKSQGVTAGGHVSSATAILKPIDDQTISWESRDRADDGPRAINTMAVILKRRAPPPAVE